MTKATRTIKTILTKVLTGSHTCINDALKRNVKVHETDIKQQFSVIVTVPSLKE